MRYRLTLPAALLSVLLTSSAPARTYSSVTMDDTMALGGATLKLNGMGLRKKAIFKVYVGGLYVPTPSKKEADIITPDVPKALVMHFVRDVGRGKMVEAYQDGFNNNAKDKVPKLKSEIARFLAMVSDVKEDQRIVFTYEPGKGSTVTMPNGKKETFAGKDFADAYLLVFLGADPPTSDLKNGLMGR
ncbi:MAG: chalcone isomerase family protein [Myxococcota bacterium]